MNTNYSSYFFNLNYNPPPSMPNIQCNQRKLPFYMFSSLTTALQKKPKIKVYKFQSSTNSKTLLFVVIP